MRELLNYDLERIKVDKARNKRYDGDVYLDEESTVELDSLIKSILRGWKIHSQIYVKEYNSVEEKNKAKADYFVVEGNRRMTCIKLINDFSLYDSFLEKGLTEELSDETKKLIEASNLDEIKPRIICIEDEDEEEEIVIESHIDNQKKALSTLTRYIIEEKRYFRKKKIGENIKSVKLDIKIALGLFRYFQDMLGTDFIDDKNEYTQYKKNPSALTKILLLNVIKDGKTVTSALNISVHEDFNENKFKLVIGEKELIFQNFAKWILKDFCNGTDRIIKNTGMKIININNKELQELISEIFKDDEEIEANKKNEDRKDKGNNKGQYQGGENQNGSGSSYGNSGSSSTKKDPPKVYLKNMKSEERIISITIGTRFYATDYFEAKDYNNNLLTISVRYDNKDPLNSLKEGSYKVYISATDNLGQTSEEEFLIVIINPNTSKRGKSTTIYLNREYFKFTEEEQRSFDLPPSDLTLKIINVINELNSLSFEKHRIAMVSLLRILIELCCRRVFSIFQMEYKEQNLSANVNTAINLLKNPLPKDKDGKKIIPFDPKEASIFRNFVNKENFIESLNVYMHKENPIPDYYEKNWESIKPFLLACLRLKSINTNPDKKFFSKTH